MRWIILVFAIVCWHPYAFGVPEYEAEFGVEPATIHSKGVHGCWSLRLDDGFLDFRIAIRLRGGHGPRWHALDKTWY